MNGRCLQGMNGRSTLKIYRALFGLHREATIRFCSFLFVLIRVTGGLNIFIKTGFIPFFREAIIFFALCDLCFPFAGVLRVGFLCVLCVFAVNIFFGFFWHFPFMAPACPGWALAIPGFLSKNISENSVDFTRSI